MKEIFVSHFCKFCMSAIFSLLQCGVWVARYEENTAASYQYVIEKDGVLKNLFSNYGYSLIL